MTAVAGPSASTARILRALRAHGHLLLSDPELPSVAALVAGRPLRSSWWGHPKGREIYRVVCDLSRHPDVLCCKLVSGKVTFVHRRLWPAVLAAARDPKRREGLSAGARSLLESVRRRGEVRTDRSRIARRRGRADPVKELEERLLVHSEEIHTERGAHAKRLETWERWERRMGVQAIGRALHARPQAGLLRRRTSRRRLPLPSP